MATAVLFDFGNTLAQYYRREDFSSVLGRCVALTRQRVQETGRDVAAFEVVLERAVALNQEADDFRFNPMVDRLVNIFDLDEDAKAELGESLCECFLTPIFEVGRLYPDTQSTLKHMRSQGYKTAIVSNTPWGSPPALWRREFRRLGLPQLVDAIVLCGDIGWRKPAKQVFQHAVDLIGVQLEECVFVGDDLEWDIEGSAAAGMRPILIDHENRYPDFSGERISSLSDLVALLCHDEP